MRGDGSAAATTGPTADEVWRQLAKHSFAVLSTVTPAGAPRSSGVVYTAQDRHLFVVTATDSWKAKHIAGRGLVAVTVPVRRGGILAMVAPIPPATITFHGTATVHAAGAIEIPEGLRSLVPPQRRDSGCVVEIVPEGVFLTYGLGVSLGQMRDPVAALARVPVAPGP